MELVWSWCSWCGVETVQGDRQSAASTLSWRIREQHGFTVVELSGELNETADFASVRERLKGPVVLHMGGVRRINSGGVREWVNIMRDLSSTSMDVTPTHCTPVIVAQLNMIYSFCGKARVLSFYAPYACSRCDHEEEKLIYVQTHFPTHDFTRMPAFHCSVCGENMEFDEIVERYLGFLKQV